MADVWGFKKQNHDTLLQVARERRLQPQGSVTVDPLTPSRLRQWVVAKTPAGGISARTNDTPGSAVCVIYHLNADGDLEALTDANNNDVTETILNMAGDIAADTYIQFKMDADGNRWADTEDCG
jgi:hypothetical protein